MRRLKVLTFVGTRPELVKLCRVIAELEAHTDHVLVHTGQNYDYELNEVFFRELSIAPPRHYLGAASASAVETVGKVIAGADPVLEAERPDAVLVLGDTNSCLAAYTAKRRRIPVFHMEAGNRSFDERIPEEINRRIIDHISDINMPYTEHARRYLLAEGIPPQRVIKTGSPMREVLEYYRPGIDESGALERHGLTPGNYFMASAHREENVDDPQRLTQLVAALGTLAAKHDLPVLFSTHPRTRKRLDAQGDALQADPRVRFLRPLGFLDWVRLQKSARCVLSDSGTLTEEAGILGFPAVALRDAHERPEGMDEGTLVLCGLSTERVLQGVELVTAQQRDGGAVFRPAEDYGPDNVSRKVVRIVLSYVDYVNRTVWFRP